MAACTYPTKYTGSVKVQISSGMNDVIDVICTLLLCKYPSIDAVYEYSVPWIPSSDADASDNASRTHRFFTPRCFGLFHLWHYHSKTSSLKRIDEKNVSISASPECAVLHRTSAMTRLYSTTPSG